MDTGTDDFSCACEKCNVRFEKVVTEINAIRLQNEMLIQSMNKLMHTFNVKVTDLYANVDHVKKYVPGAQQDRGPVILQNYFK